MKRRREEKATQGRRAARHAPLEPVAHARRLVAVEHAPAKEEGLIHIRKVLYLRKGQLEHAPRGERLRLQRRQEAAHLPCEEEKGEGGV